jgi:large subunit ribosomal protein L4
MSLAVDVRAADGSPAGTVTLAADHFGIEPNVSVLHQVVTAQLAAARAGTQSTKTRAEVSGGGKKPFKQKGTGRARQGSERAPHFSGGGVALGPKPRSYKQRTPRKMINLALRSALSDRQSEGRVAVVSDWALTAPSTKGALAALAAIGVSGRVLVVLTRDDEEAYKSFRNLPLIQVILRGELNAYDILCNDWIVFTPATLPGHVEGEGDTPVTVGATRSGPPAEAADDIAPGADDIAPGADDIAPGAADIAPGAADAVEESAVAAADDEQDELLAEAAGATVLSEAPGETVLTDATDALLISAAADADDEAETGSPAAADAGDETAALSPPSDTDDAEEAQ